MPTYEALCNFMAGPGLRPKQGERVTLDEEKAAPLVAQGLLRQLEDVGPTGEVEPVEPSAAPAPRADEKKGKRARR